MKLFKVLFVLVFFLSCTNNPFKVYTGQAQGTTFSIKFTSVNNEDFETEIDSIFTRMDNLFSTYKKTSFISRFNKSKRGIQLEMGFRELWEYCWELNIESNGYFDPTLAPVFEFYRLHSGDELDSALLTETLSHTGMPLIKLTDDSLIKNDPLCSVNLNAVAQGYTVDVIVNFLIEKGIKDMMVEIGGEVFARGKNDRSTTWTIGIDKPKISGSRELIGSLSLDGKALATSGNYRKFTIIDGQRLGHIINPKTALPTFSNVLSVSVINNRCYRADALATALMNMTSYEIKEFDVENDDVEIVLIELINSDTVVYTSQSLTLNQIN